MVPVKIRSGPLRARFGANAHCSASGVRHREEVYGGAVGSGGLGYVSTAVVLNLLLVVAAWGRYAAETTDLLSRTAAAKSETQTGAASTSAR